MNIIIIDDDGRKSMIKNVLTYDCYTKEDVEKILGNNEDTEKINEVSRKVIKKCMKLESFPSSNEFYNIVREI